MNNQAAQTMPPVPQAFFDEFGVNADDRVWDYGHACYAAALSQTAGVADGMEELRDLAPRALELAERLVMSGPKAAHVSASETHEIADFVRDTVAVLKTMEPGETYLCQKHGSKYVAGCADCADDLEMLAAAPAASGGEDAVKAKYPEAYAYHWPDRWTIYAARHGSMQGHSLGDGATKAKAWEAAALAIPQPPSGASVSERGMANPYHREPAPKICGETLRWAASVLYMWEGDPNETGYMGDFKDAEQILHLLADHAPALEQALTQQRGEDEIDCLSENWRAGFYAGVEFEATNRLFPEINKATPQPGAEALRELVQSWRGPFVVTSRDGEDYDRGVRETLLNCADELETLLARGG